MAEPPRRFPPPWRAEPVPGGYVDRDADGRGGCAGKTARAYTLNTGHADVAPIADGATTDFIVKVTLGEAVADVRSSDRLTDSAGCLVAAEHGPDRQLARRRRTHHHGREADPRGRTIPSSSRSPASARTRR